jgi:phage baseplate assembly protein W
MNLDTKGLGLPLRLGPDRGIAVVGLEDNARAMLEQILFTLPGERVNRPTFGVGVQRYVFEANSPSLAERLRVALDENVYEHLGKSVQVLAVSVERDEYDEEQLHVRIAFEVIGSVAGPQSLEVVVPTEGVA